MQNEKVFHVDAAEGAVQHFDVILATGKPERTSQGFLRIPARLTGVGIFPYRDPANPSRMIRRFRPPSEVFKPESMATIKLSPVVSPHPPVMVTPENVKEYRKGVGSENVEIEGDRYLIGFIQAEDADLIKDISDNGLRQISCGYMAMIDPTPGKWLCPWTGIEEDYDDSQRDIEYNHIALVAQGRQGPSTALQIDSEKVFIQDGLDTETPPRGQEAEMLKKIMLADGTEIEILIDAKSENAFQKVATALSEAHKSAHEHAGALNDLKDKHSVAVKAHDDMKATCDALKAELDDIKAKHKKGQKDATDPKILNAAVMSRVRVLATAAHFIADEGEKKKIHDLTDMELKKLTILADDPTSAEALKDATETYIDGRFDAISARTEIRDLQDGALGATLLASRSQETMDDKNKDEDTKVRDAKRKLMESKHKDFKPSASRETASKK